MINAMHIAMYIIQVLFFFPIVYLIVDQLVSLFYTCEVIEYKYLLLFLTLIITLYIPKKTKSFIEKQNPVIVILVMVTISILVVYPILFHILEPQDRPPYYDGYVKQGIANISSRANAYYKENGNSYEFLCTDPQVTRPVAGMESQKVSGSCLGIIPRSILPKSKENKHFICNSSQTEYAVEAKLMPRVKESVFDESKSKFLCVDSSGQRIETSTSIGSSTKCVAD